MAGKKNAKKNGLKEDLAAVEHRLGTRFDNHFDTLNREMGAALQRLETRLETLEAKP